VADREVVCEKDDAGGVGVGEADRARVAEGHDGIFDFRFPIFDLIRWDDQERNCRRAERDRGAAGVEGRDPFKVRAYQAGARVVESLEQAELERLIAGRRTGDDQGIGRRWRRKSASCKRRGSWDFSKNCRRRWRRGWWSCWKFEPRTKKIKVLFEKLGVASIADLTAACRDGRVRRSRGLA